MLRLTLHFRTHPLKKLTLFSIIVIHFFILSCTKQSSLFSPEPDCCRFSINLVHPLSQKQYLDNPDLIDADTSNFKLLKVRPRSPKYYAFSANYYEPPAFWVNKDDYFCENDIENIYIQVRKLTKIEKIFLGQVSRRTLPTSPLSFDAIYYVKIKLQKRSANKFISFTAENAGRLMVITLNNEIINYGIIIEAISSGIIKIGFNTKDEAENLEKELKKNLKL